MSLLRRNDSVAEECHSRDHESNGDGLIGSIGRYGRNVVGILSTAICARAFLIIVVRLEFAGLCAAYLTLSLCCASSFGVVVRLELAGLCAARLTLSLCCAGCFGEVVSLKIAVLVAACGTYCLLCAGCFAAYVSLELAVFVAAVVAYCLLIAGCFAAIVNHGNCKLVDLRVIGSGAAVGIVAEVDCLACLKGYCSLEVGKRLILGGSLRIGYGIVVVNFAANYYAVVYGRMSASPVAIELEVVCVCAVNGSCEADYCVHILLTGIPYNIVTHLGNVCIVTRICLCSVSDKSSAGSSVLNGCIRAVIPCGGRCEDTVYTVAYEEGESILVRISKVCYEVEYLAAGVTLEGAYLTDVICSEVVISEIAYYVSALSTCGLCNTSSC